jgi:hypothetical protein
VIRVSAYTPELNPSERVWPLVKEGVANRAHDGLDELEQKVCSRCQRSLPKKSRPGQVTAVDPSYESPYFVLQLGIRFLKIYSHFGYFTSLFAKCFHLLQTFSGTTN